MGVISRHPPLSCRSLLNEQIFFLQVWRKWGKASQQRRMQGVGSSYPGSLSFLGGDQFFKDLKMYLSGPYAPSYLHSQSCLVVAEETKSKHCHREK